MTKEQESAFILTTVPEMVKTLFRDAHAVSRACYNLSCLIDSYVRFQDRDSVHLKGNKLTNGYMSVTLNNPEQFINHLDELKAVFDSVMFKLSLDAFHISLSDSLKWHSSKEFRRYNSLNSLAVNSYVGRQLLNVSSDIKYVPACMYEELEKLAA